MWHYIYYFYSLHGYISCNCHNINDLLFLDDSLAAGVYIHVSHLLNIPSIIHHKLFHWEPLNFFVQKTTVSIYSLPPKESIHLCQCQVLKSQEDFPSASPSVSRTRLSIIHHKLFHWEPLNFFVQKTTVSIYSLPPKESIHLCQCQVLKSQEDFPSASPSVSRTRLSKSVYILLGETFVSQG